MAKGDTILYYEENTMSIYIMKFYQSFKNEDEIKAFKTNGMIWFEF